MTIAATILYLITAALCLRAFLRSRKSTIRVSWIVIAAFFAALAWWRIVGAEEIVRSALRNELIERGLYATRHSIQRPLAVAVLVVLMAMSAWAVLGMRPRIPRQPDRQLFWAHCAAISMAGLVMVRLVSFHPTDVLLYGGPHINRIIDPLLATIVAVQAALFARQT